MAYQFETFIEEIKGQKLAGVNAIEYANGGQEIYLSFQALLKWIGENVNLFSNGEEIIEIDWKSNKPMLMYSTSVSCNLQKCYIRNLHLGTTGGTYRTSSGVAEFHPITRFEGAQYTQNIPKQKDTGTLTMYPEVGNINYIYLNLMYLSTTLIKESDNAEGKVSIRKYLQVLCDGVNKALGSINDFQVISDVDGAGEKLVIIDYQQSRLQNLTKTAPRTEIKAQGLGSMLTNIQAQSSITPEIATMISVGAQAQGDTVGVEATSFSKLSYDLTDRIYPEKELGLTDTLELRQARSKKAKELKEQIESTYQTALQSYSEILKNQIPENADEFYGPVTLESTEVSNLENTPVELYKAALAKFTETGQTSTAFIPIKLDFSLYGISGIKIFQKFKLSNDILPLSYEGDFEFQVMGVGHTVDNSTWTTSINSLISLKEKKVPKEADIGTFGITLPIPSNTSTTPSTTNFIPLTAGSTFGSPYQSSTKNLAYIGGIENQTRNQPTQDKLFNIINKAAIDNNLFVVIFSAGQNVTGTQRVGSHRHDNGFAADINLYDANGYFIKTTPTKLLTRDGSKDQEKVEKFSKSLLQYGIHSIGAGNGYMNDVALHVDISIGQPGVPNARYFGKDKTSGKTKTIGAAKWLSKLMVNANTKYPVSK